MIPIFQGTVKQGKIQLDDKERLDMWIKQFEGKRIDITVKQHRKKRSTGKPDELGNQNGYYWAVVLPLSANELGYTVDEMHEVFTAEFAPYNYKDFGDRKVAVKIRSSKMNTVQFAEYTDAIRTKMAQMNVFIPDPEKVEV